MLRAGEALLALSPLLAALLLYGVVFHRLPTRRVVLAIAAAELVLATVLVWQSAADGLSPHEQYVPAKLEDGSVISGHGISGHGISGSGISSHGAP